MVIAGVKGYNNAVLMDSSNIALHNAFKYLINQTIRLYILPDEHKYVSLKAKEQWEKVTSADMSDYGYRCQVNADRLKDVMFVHKYKGSNKNAEKESVSIYPYKSFVFNDIFHEDHIIPVCYFVDKLLNLTESELCEERVEAILDGMYIAKILKEEDRSLPRTKRPLTFEEVLATTYKSIELQPLVKNGRFGSV